MKHYLEPIDAVFAQMSSGPEGLSSGEADLRLTKYGVNELKKQKKTSLFMRFLQQFADPMILVLLAAAVVSGITAVYAGESLADVFIILFVVVLNAVLGVVQESRAEAAIEALQAMSASHSKTLRDGIVRMLPSAQLVPGDVVLLEAGDAVPADGRLIECASLRVEEAALTGESVPVDKTTEAQTAKADGDVPLGDRRSMVYMGSSVVYGRGRLLVTGTGMNTEMGKIADALTQAQEGKTPLQRKLAQLSKVLTWLVLGICIFIFGLQLLRSGFNTAVLLDSFMIAVSLAVAAIPEGLAAVVTIVLSMGVTKMAKRGAIVRRLTAVETLGCTQIICSDKTGTLTQNRMTVVDAWGEDRRLLAVSQTLCTDADPDENGGAAVGEPTQCALVNWGMSEGFDKRKLIAETPRVAEAPFDSDRKRMTTVHRMGDGRYIQYTTGAPDEVLKVCTAFAGADGSVLPLDDARRADITAANKSMADRALRVIAASYRVLDTLPEPFTPADEQSLVFVGLCGMIDPVRPEVVDAIRECKSAGVRAIMITGDHKDTAVAIARQLGILREGDIAMTGAELSRLDDAAFEAVIEQCSVYARVQPEHKTRIVSFWQKKGKICAMTGDGVNDAPAIKTADIGVGMGITGTDVTKNVADMVLVDDNFATIVKAVEEGRRIYDNIRKAIGFLLASNLSEVLSIFTATCLGFTVLSPVHILWINLITDTFPALGLGLEKAEPDLMRRAPRDPKEGIFARGMGADVLYQGALVTVLTLVAYFVGHFMESGVWEITNSADGMTMAFLTMSMAEIFHAFNMRSQTKSVFSLRYHNRYLYGTMLLSLLLTTAVIYVPFLATLFGFTAISLAEYAAALGLAILVIPVVEIVKLFRRKR